MTHLQLDMLVYIDESKEDYEIVIGAGVPAEWLNAEMAVKNFNTKAGAVTWQYKDHKLTVNIKDASRKYHVRAGSSFLAAKASVQVTYK